MGNVAVNYPPVGGGIVSGEWALKSLSFRVDDPNDTNANYATSVCLWMGSDFTPVPGELYLADIGYTFVESSGYVNKRSVNMILSGDGLYWGGYAGAPGAFGQPTRCTLYSEVPAGYSCCYYIDFSDGYAYKGTLNQWAGKLLRIEFEHKYT